MDPSTNPFRLSSVFEEPAKPEEIKQAWAGKVLPADLLRLWEHTRSARLFEDVDYGQWGLEEGDLAERVVAALQTRC